MINTKWVFKTKRGDDGLIVWGTARSKRLFSEIRVQLHWNIFFCVVRYTSIRLLIALTAQRGLKIDQMDAVTAYLQGDTYKRGHLHPQLEIDHRNSCVRLFNFLVDCCGPWRDKLNVSTWRTWDKQGTSRILQLQEKDGMYFDRPSNVRKSKPVATPSDLSLKISSETVDENRVTALPYQEVIGTIELFVDADWGSYTDYYYWRYLALDGSSDMAVEQCRGHAHAS